MATNSRDNAGHVGAALRDMLINFNRLVTAVATLGGTGVVAASTLSRGTTVTLASTAGTITINGVTAVVAALTAQAFGALGTIPTATWGVIAVERILAGTTTFVSGANNYTTGYATEALAIAALPAISANKVRVGYITILATTPGWVAGTDALAGGAGGTPATTTNYYSDAGNTAVQIGDDRGVAITT